MHPWPLLGCALPPLEAVVRRSDGRSENSMWHAHALLVTTAGGDVADIHYMGSV